MLYSLMNRDTGKGTRILARNSLRRKLAQLFLHLLHSSYSPNYTRIVLFACVELKDDFNNESRRIKMLIFTAAIHYHLQLI